MGTRASCFIFSAIVGMSVCAFSKSALAVNIPPGVTLPPGFDPSQIPGGLEGLIPKLPNLNNFIPQSTTDGVIKLIGLGTDHRSYESASPLGTNIGLDLGAEVTLAKIPEDFEKGLDDLITSINLATGNTETKSGSTALGNIPAIPVPRLHLHKGIGQSAGLGLSYIRYKDYRIIGGEIKVVVAQPEEGLTWSARLSYSNTRFNIPLDKYKILIKTQTITPQILASKRIDFADPYIGVGYQISSGNLDITVPFTYQGYTFQLDGKSKAKASGLIAFTGLAFRADVIGLALVLEGSYSSAGVHTLGTKVGFSF